MFFDNWFGLLRVLVVGTCAYLSLVILLRVSGKRTLSKLNAFDLIVTVALGSTLATVLLTNDIALAEGVLAFAVLIFAQYVLTWLSVRSKTVRDLVKSEPRLIAWNGHMLDDALHEERVTFDEVLAVIRAKGLGSVDDVGAVVLETDGSFHVLARGETEGRAIESVRGYDSARSP